MTISSTQDSLLKPKYVISQELTSVDVSISEDGSWIATGTPIHGLDENGSNFLLEAGACFISKRVDGVHIQKQKLVDPNRLASNHFGSRVWMSAYGRRLFIASRNDSNAVSNGGSVCVFDLDETNDTWNFNLKLEVPSGPIAESKFGWSIMSDFYGQLLVVGAPFEDGAGTLRGAGYLFRDNGITFTQLNKFSYSKALDNSRLGYSVAISGDGNIIFMGMTLSDLSGGVGVFKKDISGVFPSTDNEVIRDDGGLANDYFSVAIETLNSVAGNSLVVDHSGRNLYVGAHNKLDAGSGIRGAVFRFTGDKDYNYTLKESILQRKGRTLDTETLSARFGYSLATDKLGKVLVVGAVDDGETQSGSGAVYVYKRDLLLDTYATKVKKDNPLLDDHNGRSVAISSDASIFISGDSEGDNGIVQVGSASMIIISDSPTLSLSPTSYVDIVLADNPIHYMRFGESSGIIAAAEVGADSTYTSGPTLGSDPLVASDPSATSVLINGAGRVDYSPSVLLTKSTGYSCDCWVKVSAIGAGSHIVAYQSAVGGFYITNGKPDFFPASPSESDNALVVGTIYHLAWTVDASNNGKYYTNGVSNGTFAASSGNIAINYALSHLVGAEYFEGNVQELALYDYELTAGQVLAHYNAGI